MQIMLDTSVTSSTRLVVWPPFFHLIVCLRCVEQGSCAIENVYLSKLSITYMWLRFRYPDVDTMSPKLMENVPKSPKLQYLESSSIGK